MRARAAEAPVPERAEGWRTSPSTRMVANDSMTAAPSASFLAIASTFAAYAVAGLVASPAPARLAPAAPAPGFSVERVTDRVYALVRTDPPGLMFEANAAFVVGDSGVLVVDGGSNPASARQVLAELRRVTRRPVRWVVNTHWHDDHVLGNQLWRDSFPGVEIVAHARTREGMLGDGAANRPRFAEAAPRAAAGLRERVRKGESLAGGPMGDEERASHESSVALAEHWVAEYAGVRPVAPTRVFDDTLSIALGGGVARLHWLGNAHTRGDIVVELPRERVLIVGDLVSWPVPLVGSTSFPLEFGPTLDRVLALPHVSLVPGHGPVLATDEYPRLVARLLASMARQTRAAVARGETLDQARASVDLSEFRRLIAGDSRVRDILFTQYVAGPGVARAYEAAKGEPK